MSTRLFRVNSAYRHARLGHLVIEPGDYTPAHLARYYPELIDDLRRQGRGDWLDSAPEPEPDIPAEPESDERETDYASLNRGELEALLEARGVALDSIPGTGANGNVVKADLIRALEFLA